MCSVLRLRMGDGAIRGYGKEFAFTIMTRFRSAMDFWISCLIQGIGEKRCSVLKSEVFAHANR
jgi:hypothetical protein